MPIKKNFEIISKHNLYQGFFCITQYTLKHRLFLGGWSQILKRELFTRGQVTGVLPFDPITEQVVLIEQFRPGLLQHDSPWLLEIVAGILEPEETIVRVAERETKEETGLTISELIPLYDYWVSPGGSTEYVSMFLGRVDATQAGGIHGAIDEGEDIRVITMSTQEAFIALAEKRIQNAITIIGLQWLQLHYQQIMAQWRH